LAANTFDQMARSLRLYVPQLPYTLAQQFIRDRYRRILERRNWSGLRSEGQFLLGASNTTGTVSVTRSSLTVTGASTTFAATDVGRQFKLGQSAIFTVVTVNAIAQTMVLDRAWPDASASAQTFILFDGYVTAPADFKSFMYVIDKSQGYRLRHWVTQDELNAWDAQRSNFGQPFAIVDRRYNAGVPQFEAWPYTTSVRSLAFAYYALGDDLVDDTDVPIFPIRSDAIVSGALADVCRWPGTQERVNLYFGKMDIWKSFEFEFEDKLIEIERADETIYLTWLSTQNEFTCPLAPMSSTNYLFSHGL
jgi:hypothetical protein